MTTVVKAKRTAKVTAALPPLLALETLFPVMVEVALDNFGRML